MRHEWQALCVGKRRPEEQLNHPKPSSAQFVSPHHRRRARTQVSDPPPRSGAPHQAKRRPKPGAPRWALSWGLRRAPKGGRVTGQSKCNDRATRCETPLLERPRRLVHSAHAAGLWPAPSGQRPEESGAVNRLRAVGEAFPSFWNGTQTAVGANALLQIVASVGALGPDRRLGFGVVTGDTLVNGGHGLEHHQARFANARVLVIGHSAHAGAALDRFITKVSDTPPGQVQLAATIR